MCGSPARASSTARLINAWLDTNQKPAITQPTPGLIQYTKSRNWHKSPSTRKPPTWETKLWKRTYRDGQTNHRRTLAYSHEYTNLTCETHRGAAVLPTTWNTTKRVRPASSDQWMSTYEHMSRIRWTQTTSHLNKTTKKCRPPSRIVNRS